MKTNETKLSKRLSAAIKVFQELNELYAIAEADQIEAEAIECDILHTLELTDLPRYEYERNGRKLRDILRTRRIAKDKKVVLDPYHRWFVLNQQFFNSLALVVGEMRKHEETFQNRYYTLRSGKGIIPNIDKKKDLEELHD